MKMLMTAYQDQLKALGFAGLGLRPDAASAKREQRQIRRLGKSANRATRNLTPYGRKACTPRRMRRWPNSIRRGISIPSASVATSSAGIPRNYFPYEGGYRKPGKNAKVDRRRLRILPRSGRKTHGRRSGQQRSTDGKISQGRTPDQGRLEKNSSASPATTATTAPTSNFETYWPLVEHYETSKPDANGQK